MLKQGFIYIMGNERPTLYVGVTYNLSKRVYQHRTNIIDGFTLKYGLHKLLYYESFETIQQAIFREKQIKYMNREKKLTMIKAFNALFRDLFVDLRP